MRQISTNRKIHFVLTVAGAAGIVGMFLPFASTGLLSITAWYGDWDLGAYFVLVAVIACFFQVIVVIRASREASI